MTNPNPLLARDERLAALFPDDKAPVDGSRRTRRRFRNLALAAVVVVVVVVIAASSAFGSGADPYRTAVVTEHRVTATIDGVATIEPVNQVQVGFPTSGTVATVAVKPGDPVTIGQTLATLDETSLTATLHDKEAALADAKLTLRQARNGQLSQVSQGGGFSTASTGSTQSAAAAESTDIVLTAAMTPSGPSDQDIAAAQQAVISAQRDVDAALGAADAALQTATAACTPAGSTPVDATACATALQAALDAQQATATAQSTLAKASTHLDALLAQRAAALANATSGGSSGTAGGDSTAAGGPPSSVGSGGASSGASVSAADLAKYQQAVDAAEAEVAVAQQALQQATITSPLDGTVTDVTLKAGDDVTGGSSDATVTIEGPGGYEASMAVGVDDVTKIRTGQSAVVVPDGTKTTLTGRVTAISVTPTTSGTSTTYNITISLPADNTDLHSGSIASVSVVLATTDAPRAVPTSAVATNGTRHTVTVVDGGTTRDVTVQVGMIGNAWASITSGLKAGDVVVLADLNEPLPDSATSSSNGNNDTPGGGALRLFGGGAFPGAGGR